MKKALILSYVALVAVVLLAPLPGKSEPQERIVLRSVDAGQGLIVLSDGHVIHFRGAMDDVRRDLRLRRLDRLQDLRTFDFRDRVIERNRLRGLRDMDRFQRWHELRLDRIDRLNDLRNDRLDRLNELRLDRLNRPNRLNRVWRYEEF